MARHYYLGESAARKLAGLFRGATGVGNVAGPSSGVVDEEEYPAPFRVQWSDAESSWIIWIPSGSITSDHGYEAELLGTLTGASEYGSGWYLLDELSIGSSWTPIYLDCWGAKQSSSETAPTYYYAELVTSLETHQRLVERYVVRIADAKRNSTTGATDVRQIAVGALVLKGGGSGGGGSGYEDLGPFRIEGSGYPAMKLTKCYWQQENITCYMNDVSSASTWAGSFVWLEIDEYNSASIQSGTLAALQAAETDDEKSCVPLYKFDSSFNVEIDFRNIPTIQEWMPYSSTSSS